MENELNWTPHTQSESCIEFFIPDSQPDSQNSLDGWDLVSGLPALNILSQREHQSINGPSEKAHTMSEGESEKKIRHVLNPFDSTPNESEAEGTESAALLVTDTVSDGSSSKDDSDKNVTVIERVLATEKDDQVYPNQQLVSTPAQHIGSLQFSAEPMLVPETMDSFDEVAPSPDAYGSAPMIIPDSPSVEGNAKADAEVDDEDEEDDVISFKPVEPTMNPDYEKSLYGSQEASQGKAESQSFHLKFTPAQMEDDDSQEASPGDEPLQEQSITATTSGQSQFKLRSQPSTSVPQTSASKPEFHLQEPFDITGRMESSEESQDIVSVFKRVKVGNTTPQKMKRITEDSEDFYPLPGSSRKFMIFDSVSEMKSTSKHIESEKTPTPSSNRAASPKKTGIKGKGFSESPSRKGKHLLSEEKEQDSNNNGEGSDYFKEIGSGKDSKLSLISHGTAKHSRGEEASRSVLSKQAEPVNVESAEHVSIVISEDQDSLPGDVDLTLSYDYNGGNKATSKSMDKSQDEAVITSQSEMAAEKQVVSSSDDFINPSQKRLSFAHKKSSSDEKFLGFDVYEEPTVFDESTNETKEQATSHEPVQSKNPSSSKSLSQKTSQLQVKGKTMPSSSKRTDVEMRSESQEKSKDASKQSIETNMEGDEEEEPIPQQQEIMDQGISVPVTEKASVGKNDNRTFGDTSTRTTVTSTLKKQIPSSSSNIAHSVSLDPYLFHGSQSQNFGDVSTMPLSDKPYTSTATGHGKKRTVKTMRRVLRKKAPSKEEESKLSSADDMAVHNQPKPRGRTSRKKSHQDKQQDEEEELELVEVQESREEDIAVSEQQNFTNIQKKAEFSRPQNPPPARSSRTVYTEPTDPHGSETQQLGKGEGNSETADSARQGKKSATVSFSDNRPGEVPTLVRDSSDSSDHEMERRTVQKIMTVVVTVTQKTKTEVYNSKGRRIRQSESTEVLETTTLGPTIQNELVTEHVISPVVSPSRSTSTMTTGDLADISSSSLSRTNSSGSKTSNPSLDATTTSQSLPTPAQRMRSFERQGDELLHENRLETEVQTTNVISTLSKTDQKRLSTGSNTGPDLFSTPNQSIIDRADSQLGKVISSSHSTPGSQPRISPTAVINKSQQETSYKSLTAQEGHAKGKSPVSHVGVAVSPSLPTILSPSLVSSSTYQDAEVYNTAGETGFHGQASSSEKEADGRVTEETPQKQGQGQSVIVKRILQSGNADDYDNDENGQKKDRPRGKAASSSKLSGVKRKQTDEDTSEDFSKLRAGKRIGVRKRNAGKSKEDKGDSTDIQSTGFSVHGVPPSAASVDSNKGTNVLVPSSKSGTSISPEISLQGRPLNEQVQSVILTNYKSRVETGAKVMGKWKDGFYYPGILSKVDQGNKKYMVKYDDGSQRAVKAKEIILVSDLPVGQSVMVLASSGFYEPGMVMNHSEADGMEEEVESLVYHVERDDGVTQKCKRSSLILSEDQAACLLSDEEFRVTPDAIAISTSKPADISLDNLMEGKRQSKTKRAVAGKKDQPSTSGSHTAATEPLSPSTGSADKNLETEATRSGRKRKMGPVATSTPTPKQVCREYKRKGTPVKKPAASPLGGAVSSPSESRRSPRKARTGLFEPTRSSTSKLFEGIVFLFTHIEKSAEQRAQEKKLLQDSSLDTSADDNTDIEPDVPPFVKEHLQNMIEQNGGTVLQAFDEDAIQSAKQAYLIAAEHQRTVKYLQALAAGMTIISHQWVQESVAQNKLQGLKAFVLPAGISWEKKKMMEGTRGCTALAGQTVMVVSTLDEFTKAWTSILTIARCHVITRFPARACKNDPGVDVVVSDVTCPANIVRRCHQLDVPLVSSEWVAQCLINGRLVDYQGHEKYKHNYSD